MLTLLLLNGVLCKQNVEQTGTIFSVQIHSLARLIGTKLSKRSEGTQFVIHTPKWKQRMWQSLLSSSQKFL